MPNHSDRDAFAPARDILMHHPPLPPWLVRRLLGRGEEVTWVYGPKANPAWERYATHPALFLAALALGGLWVGLGVLVSEEAPLLPYFALSAGGLVIASIFVLAFSSAYYTRLVVTNDRLVVLQGYEVCRSWAIDELPPSLVHYGTPGGVGASPSIDIGAVTSMLGSSQQFTDAKTIIAFGKRLEQIRRGEDSGR
jgi:hypothetical protein